MEKPKKILHAPAEQDKIYRDMEDKIKEIASSDDRVKKVRIYGSAKNKEFGDYVETFKPGTPTARDKSDIDAVFLVEGLENKKVELKSGYVLEDGRFVKDKNGKTVFVDGHPLMCADLTTPKNYEKNIDKPWPEGYNYTKDSKVVYES